MNDVAGTSEQIRTQGDRPGLRQPLPRTQARIFVPTMLGLMRFRRRADEVVMPKPSKKPSDESNELKPEMRDLILSFDAKDRRSEGGKKANGGSKQRRRRADKAVRAG